MNDQAEGLRKREPWLNPAEKKTSPPRIISVTSGKGGVGKTNVTANLAYAFSETFGKKVLVLDADMGLGNMDVLFNLRPRWTLRDFLFDDRALSDVLVEGPAGIRILPAASGVEEMTALTPDQNLKLISAFDQMEADFDILLIDTGAGISENVLTFNLASQETLIVVTPEPTSRTDAFALMKVLNRRFSGKPLLFLSNMVRDRKEGLELFDLVSRVADRFLPDLNLSFAGFLPQDPSVTQAVRSQKALSEMLPGAPFSAAIRQVARDLLSRPPEPGVSSGIGLLMKRLVGSEG
ncbi:MAG: MinD/ParA family protein [Nitrospirae bacterium]|jgi:flagellar biosynthesis protein FlhG|nr:MinD/ParA family protein [Nitrospirota bacterium]